MQRLPHVLLICLALLCLIPGCSQQGRHYSRWADLPLHGWAYGDTLSLYPLDTALADNDSLVRRPLILGLTHSNDYPYSNLWLEVTYHGGRHYYRDTVNVTLCDAYGRWLGHGFGIEYQHSFPLSHHADIDLRRPVTVRHIMRTDTLRGIRRIGIEVQ